MLVPMKILLDRAAKENKGVAAINVSNMETIMALLEVSEKRQEPVIIQVAPIQLTVQKMTYKQMVKMVQLFMEDYTVEAALHLDHATEVEQCIEAIDAGFTSVMFDGSLGDYDDNVANTKAVVEYAHRKGVTVEAELGKVGGSEGESEDENEAYSINSQLTDPNQVLSFVQDTNVDCLAVAIGNAHGFYKEDPKLDFQRLKAIVDICRTNQHDMPIVLHGGTGISDDDFRKSIELGVRKINFFTEIDQGFVQGFLEATHENPNIYMMTAAESGRQKMMTIINEKMKVCARKQI